MTRKEVYRTLRPTFSRVGLILLAYYGILNALVSLVIGIDSLRLYLNGMLWGELSYSPSPEELEALASNGWGYILACLVGFFVLLIWKKKDYCFRFLWKKEKTMNARSFFAILCIFLSGQAIFQTFALVLEWFFDLFGLSVLESLEAASGIGDTWSMFLYGCIFAPVFEEIFFRGFVLRSLAPYGKKFAVFGSAFLFGIFHGNIVQSPFAFVLGLVLGYVTVEYSMGWAVALHMINNLILGDLLPRAIRFLSYRAQVIVTDVIMWGFALAAAVICICKRKQIRSYLYNARIHPWCIGSFLSAPGVIAITAVMTGNVLLTFLLQILENLLG